MADPVAPDTVPLNARVPRPLRDALDAVAERESRPGVRVGRSAALRILLLEALATRGASVPA